jgi:nitrate reductase gamma subunit
MNSVDFLMWVRGPGLVIATSIFAFGLVLRGLEIFLLGQDKNLAEVRRSGVSDGFRTILTRFGLVDKHTSRHTVFTHFAGWIFHIGLLISIFLLTPHILLFESVFGFGWPALPTPIVDFSAVIAMITLIAILYHRVTNPVLKMLSTGHDYLVWALTFLPLLTGYMTYHHLFFPYTWLLAFHILSVEILMIAFPFTKLTHAFTLFFARWYNGMMAGQKGVRQ